MLSPTPTSPPYRPDWLRDSWEPTPQINLKFDGDFDSEEVLKAVLGVEASVEEDKLECEGDRGEDNHAGSTVRLMSAPIPKRASTSMAYCGCTDTSNEPAQRAPARPHSTVSRQTLNYVPEPNRLENCRTHEPAPDRDTRHLVQAALGANALPPSTNFHRYPAEREPIRLPPSARACLVRPLPSPPVAASTLSPSSRPRRPLPTPPSAKAHATHFAIRKLPTPPATPTPTSTTTSASSSPAGFSQHVALTDVDSDDTGTCTSTSEAESVSPAEARRATRLAFHGHSPQVSWTPPPQDNWVQAENGRWHLNFQDKRSSLAPTLVMSTNPVLLQMRRGQSPVPKPKPNLRVRVPHFKKFSLA